ncbi:MAG: type II toxin-antitoxin system RelE/ParE family toxin [Patescibacteria group bacterium]
MSWNVIAFESSRRENPVEKFIGAQRSQVQAKIAHLLDLLEIHGNILGMPHAKMLSKGLYELRIRGKEELRIFYCFRGKNIYLLHAFKKQTRKTPPKEIKTAISRMQSLT